MSRLRTAGVSRSDEARPVFVAALFLTAGAIKFKLAVLQIAPYGNEQNRNLAKDLQYCRNAKALGADLDVFPELWNVGSAQGLLLDRTEQRLWTGPAIDRHSTFFECFADRREGPGRGDDLRR